MSTRGKWEREASGALWPQRESSQPSNPSQSRGGGLHDIKKIVDWWTRGMRSGGAHWAHPRTTLPGLNSWASYHRDFEIHLERVMCASHKVSPSEPQALLSGSFLIQASFYLPLPIPQSDLLGTSCYPNYTKSLWPSYVALKNYFCGDPALCTFSISWGSYRGHPMLLPPTTGLWLLIKHSRTFTTLLGHFLCWSTPYLTNSGPLLCKTLLILSLRNTYLLISSQWMLHQSWFYVDLCLEN